MRLALTAVVLAAASASCGNPADNKVNAVAPSTTKVKDPGSEEARAEAAGDGGDAIDAGKVKAEIAGKNVFAGKYKIAVKVAGIDFCEGLTGLRFNIPEEATAGSAPKSPFDIKCLSLTCKIVGPIARVDSLGNMLGALASKDGKSGSGLVIDDKFIMFKSQGGITYDPPLVLLPNLTGADPKFLSRMNESRPLKLDNANSGTHASGTQHIVTKLYNQPAGSDFQAPAPYTFDKTFHFKIENNGFANEPDGIAALLFDSIEAKINLNPIAFLYARVQFRAADALTLIGKSPTGDQTYDPECGPPPPPGSDMSAITGLLGGSGFLGTIVKGIAKLVNIEAELKFLEQKGLREAFEKGKAFQDLKNSQTSGSGS